MSLSANGRDLRSWIARRAREDDRLYERFGRPLESEHVGEYVAIGADGAIILGLEELDVAERAIARFGHGNFALRRIGADAELRWRLVGRE